MEKEYPGSKHLLKGLKTPNYGCLWGTARLSAFCVFGD